MNRFCVPVIAAIISCNALYAGTVKIHGKINNPLAEEIKFTTYEGRVKFNSEEHIAKLDKDGNFSIAFPIEEAYSDVIFEHGDQASELIVASGDDLTISLDGKDFDKSIHYAGKGAQIANFTAKHVLDIGISMQFSAGIQPLFIKEPEEFLTASKEVLQKELDFLEKNKQGLPANFVAYWQAKYKYDLYYNWLIYPSVHEMYKTRSNSVKDVPKENYKVALEVPATFNDDYLGISSYRVVVGSIYTSRLDAVGVSGDQRDDSVVKLVKANMPPQTREFYFANNLMMGSRDASVAKVEKQYATFNKEYPKSKYHDVLDEAVKLKIKLGAGQPALDFAFTSLDGKKMKLSDFKGKVVYIDFWASWCGPCMGQLPSARKVEEHFNGKDVVFLNVSIDEDQEAWKKSIEKNKIEGVHTCEPGGWKSPIATLYGVKGVPSYFLVDKNGKFITESTPRPSETDKLIGLIETALK